MPLNAPGSVTARINRITRMTYGNNAKINKKKNWDWNEFIVVAVEMKIEKFHEIVPKKYEAFPELCTPLISTDIIIIQANAKHSVKYRSGIPMPFSMDVYSFSTSFLKRYFQSENWINFFVLHLMKLQFIVTWIGLGLINESIQFQIEKSFDKWENVAKSNLLV